MSSKLGIGHSTDLAEAHTVTILTREQDRRLRAQAWRHVRRINREIARKVWAKHRDKT